MPADRPWRFTAGLILIAAAILAAGQWPRFPLFFDSYYHLGVAQGFREAGGVVLHTFWEAAPEGRPHLYPPLFHILCIPELVAGMNPLTVAKLWSWGAFPFLLFVAWIVLSKITTARIACLTLIALATPYSFFLSSVNHLPTTLVLAAGLGILLAIARGRWLAGGILLSLAFWLHAGLPWILVLSLILLSGMAPSFRKTALLIIAVGMAGASPWLIHLFRHLTLIHFHPRGEDLLLDSPVVLIALGLLGFRRAWTQPGGLSRFYIALAIGFLPMAALYRFRFLSAEGMFPFLLLAGLALDGLVEKIRSRWLVGAVLALLLIGTPTLYRSASGLGLAWADTTMSMLSGRPAVFLRPSAQPLFNKRFMGELSARIQAHTKPDELIYCNHPYLGGMMNVLTGRATTNEMLRELTERSRDDEIQAARLILWIKEDTSGRPLPALEEAVLRHHLVPLGETQIAYLYLNRYASGLRRFQRPVLPGWLGLSLIGLAVGLVVWDLKRGSP